MSETENAGWAKDRNKAAPLPGKDKFGNLKSRWQSHTDTHIAKQRVLKGERPAGISPPPDQAPDWYTPNAGDGPAPPAVGSKIPVSSARKEGGQAASAADGPSEGRSTPEKHVPTGAKQAPSALRAQFETKMNSHAQKQKVLSGAMSAKAQAAEKAKREAEEAAARARQEEEERIRKAEEDARLEAEREAAAREEAERLAREEAERVARAEAARVARAEAERVAKAEAEAREMAREAASARKARSSSRPPEGRDGRDGRSRSQSRTRDDERTVEWDDRDDRGAREERGGRNPRSSSRAPDARNARSRSRAPEGGLSSRARSSSRAPPSEPDWSSEDGSEPTSPAASESSRGEFGGRKVVHHVSGRHSVATSVSEGEYAYETSSESGGRRRRRRTGMSESETDEPEETTPTAEHAPVPWDEMLSSAGVGRMDSRQAAYSLGGRKGAPTPPAKDGPSGRPPIAPSSEPFKALPPFPPSAAAAAAYAASIYEPPPRGSSEAASAAADIAAIAAAASLQAPASSLPALAKKISTEQLSQYLGTGPLYSSYERPSLRSQASREKLAPTAENSGSTMKRQRSYNHLTREAAQLGDLPTSPISFVGIRPFARDGEVSAPIVATDRFGTSSSNEVGRIWVSRASRTEGLPRELAKKGAVTPKLVSVKVDVNAWYPPSSRQASVEAVESARALAAKTARRTSRRGKTRAYSSTSEYPAVRRMKADRTFTDPEPVREQDDDWDAWADEVLDEVVAAAAKAAEADVPRGRGQTREVRMEESPRETVNGEKGWKKWRFFSRVTRVMTKGFGRKRSKTPERSTGSRGGSVASITHGTGSRSPKVKTGFFGRRAK
ncbi:hypothetical protein M427DRAFT_32970 [Gonapodya prolifera JEL478]|uniref:Uncharacterized protein n=1 Tax=Gonapodya prolifera (strain JEL478) TaxID=1344416 RepID=A0A139ACV3_GONPJ|nr:hypothetical protein M427DRAFT_32970 [Gonapodya prolifera JEL478]|eukprot:KXS14499.1 hypothetical protein M427DRAFT_32970 [Gonapodya prolifera JEL478]